MNTPYNYTIAELTASDSTTLTDLDALMHELSTRASCNGQRLLDILSDANAHLYVARHNNHIVATASLCIAHTPEKRLGFIEAVVVSTSHRGQGLGRRLMEHILQEARRLGVDTLHLTSNPRRVAANALYRRLGFDHYETNVYKLQLS